MHAVVWRALRMAHQSHRHLACRIIAGVRHSRSQNFHRSAIAYRIPENPADPAANGTKDGVEGPDGVKRQSLTQGEVLEGDGMISESKPSSPRARRRGDYGSGIRRAIKKQSPEIPPLILPSWFWKKNTALWEEVATKESRLDLWGCDRRGNQTTTVDNEIEDLDRLLNFTTTSLPSDSHEQLLVALTNALITTTIWIRRARETLRNVRATDPSYSEETAEEPVRLGRKKFVPDRRYHLHYDVYNEVTSSLKADLVLPFPKNNIKDVLRPDTLLLSPESKLSNFLDAIIDKVATDLGADVVRLDLEDIAQIFSEYLGENIAWTRSPIALLGHRSARISNRSETPENEEPIDEEYDDVDEDESTPNSFTLDNPGTKAGRSPIEAAFAILQTPSRLSQAQDLSKGMSIVNFLTQATSPSSSAPQLVSPSENWMDYKLGRAIETLVSAADDKRARRLTADSGNGPGSESPVPARRGLILHINNYTSLEDDDTGAKILKKLREAVKRRWSEGNKVVIVGTAAQPQIEHGWRSQLDWVQSISKEPRYDARKTIFIPPKKGTSRQAARFAADRRSRIRHLNIRRVNAMIEKMLSVSTGSSLAIHLAKDIPQNERLHSDLERREWTPTRVCKMAMTVVALGGPSTVYDGTNLLRAWTMLDQSEKAKEAWATEEDEAQEMLDNVVKGRGADRTSLAKTVSQNKVDEIRKSCTPHEKKLLGGVIDPADIHTTFADVQAPSETVEALKTLTTISLLRPESFSYGVLATDKIPGLLLYGPPGTGKTLLAKAVAKESGATVLEVSGAEINDKYVGEGERNVKALFSLAKKLSPCVVFIDEADSLLRSRASDTNRASHRDLINQFLREWDGMRDLSTFIMVATNRPFDLDEAVIRRLPRRLLVDLPLEKDREVILKIHLKEELLDESISLTRLAKETPFYSGSDLKNLSVAAALACVREENEAATKHTGDTPYVYPPKRILRKEHFDKAMEEISASISEDMSTLAAIRKFDERYGDRKGRRKKTAIGFGDVVEPEKNSEAGRVRKWNLHL